MSSRPCFSETPDRRTHDALYDWARATVAGPIGFVGLMAPLTASWLMGPHRGWIVALCALGGPIVVLTADVLGRVLARPGEMQVGLLTAFVGSPVLLLMVLRLKDRAS